MATTTQAPATGGLTKGKVKHYKMLIGGEWIDASGAARFPTLNPATGETTAEIAEARATDIDAAANAARAALADLRDARDDLVHAQSLGRHHLALFPGVF